MIVIIVVASPRRALSVNKNDPPDFPVRTSTVSRSSADANALRITKRASL